MSNLIKSIFLAFFISPVFSMSVAFINPDSKGQPFWDKVSAFANHVAKDLGIEFKVYNGNNHWLATTKKAIEVINSKNRPDYLIILHQFGQGQSILEEAKKRGVKVFIINTNLPESDRLKMSYPREKYKNWIGHLIPDDELTGYELAKELVANSELNYKENKKIEVIGISGSYDSSAAFDRNQGLERYIKSNPNTLLRQVVFANWSPEESQEKTKMLLKRYPHISVIWAASDGMALGAYKAVAKTGVRSKKIFVGGVDGTEDALKKIESGELSVTFGGHFIEAGIALLMLYDYHQGVDFYEGEKLNKSKMTKINRENVSTYKKMIDKESWKQIDFKKFTKSHNKKLKKYVFDLKDFY